MDEKTKAVTSPKPWYKGKDVSTNKWVYGNKQSKNELYQETRTKKKVFLVEPKSVCLFSALKDSNQKGLYEGDILIFTGINSQGEEVENIGILHNGINPKTDSLRWWFEMRDGSKWRVDLSQMKVSAPAGLNKKMELFQNAYDWYGPDWNTDDEEDKE